MMFKLPASNVPLIGRMLTEVRVADSSLYPAVVMVPSV